MAKKKKKYNSFVFYSNHSIMRVVLLSMLAACLGVVLGAVVLSFFILH